MASRDTRELILDNLIDLKEDGTFRLDQSYFDYCTGLRMTNGRFDALFGGPRADAREDRSPSATWTWPPRSRR